MHILTVSGIPSSGKTTLITELLKLFPICRAVRVLDLLHIRDRLIAQSPSLLRELHTRLGWCPQKACESMIIPGVVFSSHGLSIYYNWLAELCLPYFLHELNEENQNIFLYILELITPIDRMWDIGDIWIEMRPPGWKIDRRMAKRERIALAKARVRRCAYEKYASTITTSRQPQIILNESDTINARRVKSILEGARWDGF
jgi:hypothetical protein